MEVRDYVIRRLLVIVPTVFAITVVTFFLSRMAASPRALYLKGYPTQEQIQLIQEKYHLNEPLWVQYWYWLEGALQGDLGWSEVSGAPVAEMIARLAPASLEIAFAGMLVAVSIALVLGTLSGKYQDSWIDHLSRALAVTGTSTPRFWLGLMLLYVGYAMLGIFPIGRATSSVWESIPHPTGFYTVDAILALNATALFDAIWHLFLPAIVIGYAGSALITRHLRSEIIEKSREEYANAARARGLSESSVYSKHIRRNALIPTVTVAMTGFAHMIGGIVALELIYTWPGLGRWIVNAAVAGDVASVLGFILVVSITILLWMLLLDVIYVHLDPRIELGE